MHEFVVDIFNTFFFFLFLAINKYFHVCEIPVP